jgi:hypothetical protein
MADISKMKNPVFVVDMDQYSILKNIEDITFDVNYEPEFKFRGLYDAPIVCVPTFTYTPYCHDIRPGTPRKDESQISNPIRVSDSRQALAVIVTMAVITLTAIFIGMI